ncbi:hypothetical protein [Bacillus bingmayongensis]|uniref:hypothetical protein n=1 Tax=Bacillus bingmayongensis TaxID=1150157 RepID=UPI00031C7480|nr:hypothetical protein [Bacillus bingmayongensis]MBY0595212.1 hypothetical protein [Bacillus bingmayongensis]
MYKEFEDYLFGYFTVDYWYDEGCLIAQEMLLEFSSHDWEELLNMAVTKPLEWQRKLAYLLDNECSMNELKVLLIMLDTDDKELFEICVDTLRSFSSSESKQLILENPSIIQRVNDLIPQAGVATRKILEDFLSKIQS